MTRKKLSIVPPDAQPTVPAPTPFEELTVEEFLATETEGEGLIAIRVRANGTSAYRAFGLSFAGLAEVLRITNDQVATATIARLIDSETRRAAMLAAGGVAVEG